METDEDKVDNPFATDEVAVITDGVEGGLEGKPTVIHSDPQIAAAAQALALAAGITRAEATAMILARKLAAEERASQEQS